MKDWSSYVTIVIGGPIYAGQIRKEVTAFCEEHMELLKQKRLGLFICGMQEEAVVLEELQRSFPPELLETARVSAHFGGEYNFDKMNFLDRTLVKKIAKVTTNQSDIKEETFAAFAEKLNERSGKEGDPHDSSKERSDPPSLGHDRRLLLLRHTLLGKLL
ncbi:flavodoxin domain-containing protein [Atopococcus tabaci]|uniref:flavodoxin domain-containing protein n=1 Tax=Atopococcus tabaci TaxID=269774 RepID=UPI00042A272C|nr:flavodoxin domain-containing protein [Atopococcus tabaci]